MSELQFAHQLVDQGQFKQAESIYRQQLQLNPQNGEAYWGMGRIGMAVNSFEVAVGMFQNAVKLLPNLPMPLLHLGDAYNALRQFDNAGQCYKKAMQLNPAFAQAAYQYGNYLVGTGEIAEAKRCFRSALKSDPNFVHAYWSLARVKTFKSRQDKDMVSMKRLLAQNSEEPQGQMALHYALAKAYYDLGDKSRTMEQLDKANGIQYRFTEFSVEELKPFFQSIKETFNADLMATRAAVNEAMATPIFIIGQPRSGSTLLEMMLGAHTEIQALGELPFIGREVAAASYRMTSKHFPASSTELTESQLYELGQVYQKAAAAESMEKPYFTDKQPSNFQSVGHILRILPNAKFIHLKRHPMDVGFSVYRNFFDQNEPNFCSLKDIGLYHRYYEDMMAHWHQLLPGVILDVHYEDLVTEPKKILSQILAFCGLEWQQQCLEAYRKRGYVQTLSEVEINQPVHNKSVNRSAPYAEFLTELTQALGDSISSYEARK